MDTTPKDNLTPHTLNGSLHKLTGWSISAIRPNASLTWEKTAYQLLLPVLFVPSLHLRLRRYAAAFAVLVLCARVATASMWPGISNDRTKVWTVRVGYCPA